METTVLLEHLIELAERMEIEIRCVRLGGQGGGLCRIKGKHVLFINASADEMERLYRAAQALCDYPGIDELYIIPEIRELLDRCREL